MCQLPVVMLAGIPIEDRLRTNERATAPLMNDMVEDGSRIISLVY